MGLAIGNSEKYVDWDVVIPTGNINESVQRLLPGMHDMITIPSRSYVIDDNDPDETIRIAGERNRLIDPGIFNSGLKKDEIDKIKALKDTPTAKDYLSVEGRKPLLVIHPVYLRDNPKHKEIQDRFNCDDNYLLGFAVGFPKSGDGIMVKYKVNQRKFEEMQQERDEMEDDEYDED